MFFFRNDYDYFSNDYFSTQTRFSASFVNTAALPDTTSLQLIGAKQEEATSALPKPIQDVHVNRLLDAAFPESDVALSSSVPADVVQEDLQRRLLLASLASSSKVTGGPDNNIHQTGWQHSLTSTIAMALSDTQCTDTFSGADCMSIAVSLSHSPQCCFHSGT